LAGSYGEQVYVDEAAEGKDAAKKSFFTGYLRVMMVALTKALPKFKRKISGE